MTSVYRRFAANTCALHRTSIASRREREPARKGQFSQQNRMSRAQHIKKQDKPSIINYLAKKNSWRNRYAQPAILKISKEKDANRPGSLRAYLFYLDDLSNNYCVLFILVDHPSAISLETHNLSPRSYWGVRGTYLFSEGARRLRVHRR